MSYIRKCFISGFISDIDYCETNFKELLITRAVDLDFEVVCLKRYSEIISYLN